MRVNIYAEEMTDRLEIITKVCEGREMIDLVAVRKQAWETRRKKYGQRGHRGAYSSPHNSIRLASATDLLIRLYREGVLSEGQVSKATGLDRVSCRDLAIQQVAKETSKEQP